MCCKMNADVTKLLKKKSPKTSLLLLYQGDFRGANWLIEAKLDRI